jgi:hypothetical protein
VSAWARIRAFFVAPDPTTRAIPYAELERHVCERKDFKAWEQELVDPAGHPYDWKERGL